MFLSNTKSSAWKQFTNLPLTSSRSLAMLRKELIMIQQYNKQPHNNNNTQQQRNHHSASHPSILAKHNYYSTMVRFIRARLHLLCVAWDSDLHIYICRRSVKAVSDRLGGWPNDERGSVSSGGARCYLSINITMGDKHICNTPRWCLLPPISSPTHCIWSWAPYTTIGCRS